VVVEEVNNNNEITSMSIEDESKQRTTMAFPRSSVMACRKILFEYGLSLQEFISQMILLVENRDPRIKSILESAKTNKSANATNMLSGDQRVLTNSRSIYAALDRNSPFNKDSEE